MRLETISRSQEPELLPPTPAETEQDVDLNFAPANETNESNVDPAIIDKPASIYR